MDGGAQWAAVHGVAKSQTRLTDLDPLPEPELLTMGSSVTKRHMLLLLSHFSHVRLCVTP